MKTLHVPEWNRKVTLRAMSGAERDAWDQELIKRREGGGGAVANISALSAARSIIDEQGNRVFADEDADALGKKSGKALDRIFNAFMRLNRLTEKDLAELEKNF